MVFPTLPLECRLPRNCSCRTRFCLITTSVEVFTRTAVAKVLMVPPAIETIGFSHGNPDAAAGTGDGVPIQVDLDSVRAGDQPIARAGQIVIQRQVGENCRAAESVGLYRGTGQNRQACHKDSEREACRSTGVRARGVLLMAFFLREDGAVARYGRRVRESLENPWKVPASPQRVSDAENAVVHHIILGLQSAHAARVRRSPRTV